MSSTFSSFFQPLNSYEYFYNLLPCYIFMITGTLRYIYLETHKPIIKDDVSSSSSSSEDLSKPSFLNNETFRDIESIRAPPSFYIKTKISKIIAYSYILAIFLSFICSKDHFWAANFKIQCIVFIFGFLAWFFSGFLIQKEFEQENRQHFFTHIFFWPFSAIMSFIVIFQSQDFIITILLGLFRCFLQIILTVYGFYKPWDCNQTGGKNISQPKLISKFFNLFEKNKYSQYLIGFPILNKSETLEIEIPLIPNDSNLSIPLESQKSEKDINPLLKNIPKDVTIKLVGMNIKKDNDLKINKIFYLLSTEINSIKYSSEHIYNDFLLLEEDLIEIYSPQKQPFATEPLPLINKYHFECIDEEKQLYSQIIESLEQFLQDIFKNPIYVHRKVLSFLCIDEERSVPYLKFYDHYSNFHTNLEDLEAQRKGTGIFVKHIKKNKHKIRKSCTEFAPLFMPDEIDIDIDGQRKPKAFFEVICQNWQKSDSTSYFEYILEVKYLSTPVQEWNITKTFKALKDFHKKLEETKGFLINLFENFIPNPPNYTIAMDEKFLRLRKDGFTKYFKALLSNRNYYIDELYDFLEFDIEREEHINFSILSIIKPNLDSSEKNLKERKESCQDNDNIVFHYKLSADYHENEKETERLEICLSPKYKKKKKFDGINFNFVIIKLDAVKSIRIPSSSEDIYETYYYLNLYEYYETIQKFKKPKTIIKILKKYNDIWNLNQEILRRFTDLEVEDLDFPEEKCENVSLSDAYKLKLKWENYFFVMLRIPRIEENESFKEFFNLNRLGLDYKFSRGELELFDFSLN